MYNFTSYAHPDETVPSALDRRPAAPRPTALHQRCRGDESPPLRPLDSHNDVTTKTVAGFDIGKRSTQGHTDLARLREDGVGGVFFAVYVGANFVKANQSAHRALEMIDTVRRDIAGRYPEDFALRASAAGVWQRTSKAGSRR